MEQKKSVLIRVLEKFRRGPSQREKVAVELSSQLAIRIGELHKEIKAQADNAAEYQAELEAGAESLKRELAATQAVLTEKDRTIQRLESDISYHKSLQDRLMVANGLSPVKRESVDPTIIGLTGDDLPVAEGAERFGG